MDHAEIVILQEAYQISLCSFLQSQNSVNLEVHIKSSYFLAILTAKHEKGSLQIRSSILF